MYMCADCGFVFEEPKHYTETHGLDTPPYEEWSGCPLCSGAYSKTLQCDECGRFFTGNYLVYDYMVICEDCYQIRNTEDEM